MLSVKWISCKHSNNVVQQVDTPGKAAFLLQKTNRSYRVT